MHAVNASACRFDDSIAEIGDPKSGKLTVVARRLLSQIMFPFIYYIVYEWARAAILQATLIH